MKNKGIAAAAKVQRRWDAFERQTKSYVDCAEGRHRMPEPVRDSYPDGSYNTRYPSHACALADPLEFLKKEEVNSERARLTMERLGYSRPAPPSGSVGDAGSASRGPEGGAEKAPKSKKPRHRKQRPNQPGGSGDESPSRAAAAAR